MLSGMTRKFFFSPIAPQLLMTPRSGLNRFESESAVSRSSASYVSVFSSLLALPNEQYMMKPTSWLSETFEFGVTNSVQTIARSLKKPSPVAS